MSDGMLKTCSAKGLLIETDSYLFSNVEVRLFSPRTSVSARKDSRRIHHEMGAT